jgi:hypothetical protein
MEMRTSIGPPGAAAEAPQQLRFLLPFIEV